MSISIIPAEDTGDKTYAEMDLEAGKKHIYVFLLLWGEKRTSKRQKQLAERSACLGSQFERTQATVLGTCSRRSILDVRGEAPKS